MYGRDDLHAATARLMDRMNVDEWTAQTHLPVIRSIIATGNGPEDLALLLGLEDLTGVGIDHAILARLIRWYGRESLRRIIDGQNGPDFPLSRVTSTVIHMYAPRAHGVRARFAGSPNPTRGSTPTTRTGRRTRM